MIEHYHLLRHLQMQKERGQLSAEELRLLEGLELFTSIIHQADIMEIEIVLYSDQYSDDLNIVHVGNFGNSCFYGICSFIQKHYSSLEVLEEIKPSIDNLALYIANDLGEEALKEISQKAEARLKEIEAEKVRNLEENLGDLDDHPF